MPAVGDRSSRSICPDFSEIIYEAKERRSRRRDAPQPWIVRKLAVGFVVGIVGYSYYVYVVTFCTPMIQRHRSALGNHRIGIALMVTFNVLFLMFVWAYLKVIFTSPGYALEHTHQTPPPVPRSSEPLQVENNGSAVADSLSEEGDGEGNEPHQLTMGNSGSSNSGGIGRSHQAGTNMTEAGRNRQPSFQHYPRQHETIAPSSVVEIEDDSLQTSPADTLPHAAAGRATREERQRERNIEDGLPPPFYSRRPPTHPVLSPEYRYCPRDGIIKPMRTHHCRACGACVLKYDHHCPWIGQCVGAYNQKFFINFLQWTSVFTLFVFVSILVMYARLSTLSPEPPVNAQHFVVLGLSCLFALFSNVLLMTQMYLATYNMTTVEHLHLQRMQEREKGILGEITGVGSPCSSTRSSRRYRSGLADFKRPRWPWQAILLRKEMRKHWDQEWGKLGTEGNLWWLGSKHANWEAVMGKSKWGWFLPLGHSIGDGLSYPRNPRFDPDGRWRRRSEWPDGLR